MKSPFPLLMLSVIYLYLGGGEEVCKLTNLTRHMYDRAVIHAGAPRELCMMQRSSSTTVAANEMAGVCLVRVADTLVSVVQLLMF